MSKAKEFLDSLTHEQLADRLSLALAGGGLGIWDWDLRDDSVQFDRRWCEMLGLVHDDTAMALDTWKSRVHPDDLAACYRDIGAHLEGKVDRYENIHRMRHADGRWIYILDRGRVSGRDEHGRPIRFTGTHLDVTVTEHANRVLADHGRQLEALVANLPSKVAMLDRELRLTAASARWLSEHHLGAEVIGRPLAEVAPAVATRWAAPLAAAIDGHGDRSDEDLGEDGRWRRWDIRPWRSGGGDIGGALLTSEDITVTVERRRALEREREARLAALAVFAGGLAHELNSPLQTISLEASLLRRRLASPELDRTALEEGVAAISTTVGQAAAITRALRTMSRDARHDPPAPIAIEALLVDAEALCRRRYESRGVSLTVDDRSGGAYASGRAAELLSALLNLLDNATDAARDGAPWIRLEVEVVGAALVFRVIDGGPGIAAEHRGRLTEAFFTTKEAGRGTGLGLTIATTLAERNAGYLVHRAEAAATTFELGVPLVGGATPVRAGPA
jgi:signal transduction histidine kinase